MFLLSKKKSCTIIFCLRYKLVFCPNPKYVLKRTTHSIVQHTLVLHRNLLDYVVEIYNLYLTIQ